MSDQTKYPSYVRFTLDDLLAGDMPDKFRILRLVEHFGYLDTSSLCNMSGLIGKDGYAAVKRHLARLQKEGRITRDNGIARFAWQGLPRLAETDPRLKAFRAVSGKHRLAGIPSLERASKARLALHDQQQMPWRLFDHEYAFLHGLGAFRETGFWAIGLPKTLQASAAYDDFVQYASKCHGWAPLELGVCWLVSAVTNTERAIKKPNGFMVHMLKNYGQQSEGDVMNDAVLNLAERISCPTLSLRLSLPEE